MLDKLAAFFFLAALVGAAGCGAPGDAPPPCGDPCLLSDAHNFSYTSTLDVVEVEAMAEADVVIGWPELTVDMRGATMSPPEVDQLVLAVFSGLSAEEVAQGLAMDALDQADVTHYFLCTPVDERCPLSAFGLLGSYPGVDQYFTADRGTWLVALESADVQGARSLVFLRPDAQSEVVEVAVGPGSATLAIDAHLDGEPIRLDPWDATLDWSGLSRTGTGAALGLNQLDRLTLAHTAMAPSAVEESFAQLDHLATESWELDVAGRTEATLGELDGFLGLTDEGTWLLALGCTVCDNPVPRFLGVLR